MIVLGIETSCDETAAALVTDRREILANLVLSQLKEHAPYGGIVPEIAARSHIDHLDGLIARTMERVGIQFCDLDCTSKGARSKRCLVSHAEEVDLVGREAARQRGVGKTVAVNTQRH